MVKDWAPENVDLIIAARPKQANLKLGWDRTIQGQYQVLAYAMFGTYLIVEAIPVTNLI